jgi:hypothetical protein
VIHDLTPEEDENAWERFLASARLCETFSNPFKGVAHELRSPAENENARGKIPRVSLGMTLVVISNPSAMHRINSVRDLSPILFEGEYEAREGMI